MKIGIIGMGRMGAGIARRLMRAGHETVVYDRAPDAVAAVVKDGAMAATDLADLKAKLPAPAIYWVMLPAGDPTEQTITTLAAQAAPGDVIIDGGNSFYKDDIRRQRRWRRRESVTLILVPQAACGGLSAAIA